MKSYIMTISVSYKKDEIVDNRQIKKKPIIPK